MVDRGPREHPADAPPPGAGPGEQAGHGPDRRVGRVLVAVGPRHAGVAHQPAERRSRLDRAPPDGLVVEVRDQPARARPRVVAPGLLTEPGGPLLRGKPANDSRGCELVALAEAPRRRSARAEDAARSAQGTVSAGTTRMPSSVPSPLTARPPTSRDLRDEDDVQPAGAVHALDPAELDVAGGRGSADPGLRAARVEPGEGVGDVGHDLVLAHDADVQVGQQGDDPAALARPVVEHDGAGLGDADGGGGDDGVDGVESAWVSPSSTTAPGTSSSSPGGTTTESCRPAPLLTVAARSAAAQRVTVAR